MVSFIVRPAWWALDVSVGARASNLFYFIIFFRTRTRLLFGSHTFKIHARPTMCWITTIMVMMIRFQEVKYWLSVILDRFEQTQPDEFKTRLCNGKAHTQTGTTKSVALSANMSFYVFVCVCLCVTKSRMRHGLARDFALLIRTQPTALTSKVLTVSSFLARSLVPVCSALVNRARVRPLPNFGYSSA